MHRRVVLLEWRVVAVVAINQPLAIFPVLYGMSIE